MLVSPECIPCYLNQVLNTMRAAGTPEKEQSALLLDLLPEIARLGTDQTPSHNSSVLLLKAYQRIGSNDPFVKAKAVSNRQAETALKTMGGRISQGVDPLTAALKLAVAGNVIDLGIFEEYDLEASLGEVEQQQFDPAAVSALRKALDKADRILVVGDNSGEIVFDRIIVQYLLDQGKTVTYSVKSGPILNDAIRFDAEEAGMSGLVPVIETGSRFLGVEWDLCSEQFQENWKAADLVLAKGQANYESIEGTRWAGRKTFFLLKAKCPVVAKHLGVDLGDWVLRQN